MTKKSPTKKPQFPKRFLWGAATAAHQVEGGNHNQWTVWELEHAKTKAAQAEYHFGSSPVWDDIKAEAKTPSNYVSGALANHYERYEEDFALLEKMHMNSFRFSVEWSRIEPEEGSWNAEAIDHYKRYIAELRRRNIEPVITLFHFTLPVWFAERGGFEKRANIKYFVRFAEKVMSEIARDVTYVITINEPDAYVYMGYMAQEWPPMGKGWFKTYRVLRNLIAAHNKAAKRIHALGRRHKVSIAKHSIYYYPGDDAWLTRWSTAIMQYLQDDYILRRVSKHCDFIGINHYLSFRVYGYRVHNPDEHLSDLHWDMAPDNLQYALERVYQKYKKPILITENGLADRDDEYRKWWIGRTVLAMHQAMDEGVELLGYLYWSLLDNFEWDKGKWPRFGLAAVDYETGERTLRPSAVWFGQLIKKLRGQR